MRFSIIVPVYGTEKTLDTCVSSILCQSYTDFEVILVDDCSPDNCPALCDSWAKKDNRIKVIHKKENQGLGFARNTGMENALGEYVLFCDSDDTILPDTFNTCNCALQRNADSVDILVFGLELHYEGNGQKVKWKEYLVPKALTANTTQEKADMFHRLNETKTFSYVCNKAYRRTMLAECGVKFEQTKLIEDFLFNIRVFGYAQKLTALSQALYIYRKPMHETLASQYNPDFFASSQRKFTLEESFLKSCDCLYGEYRNQIYHGYINHFISAMIRNQSAKANMSHKRRIAAVAQMGTSAQTRLIADRINPRGLQYKIICRAIRRKQWFILDLLAAGIGFMQGHLLPLFRRFI